MEKKEVLNLGFEIKEIKDDCMNFIAYGSTTGVKDRDNDIIEKGAYSNIIKKAEQTGKYPKLLYQHSRHDVIGVIEELKEDNKGLLVTGRFIDTTKGRDAYTEVKEGAIDSMSIGFIIGDFKLNSETGVRNILIIKELPEISFVTFPANEQANVVQVKRLDGTIDVRELETYLRGVFSRNEAKAIIAGGVPTLKQRDAESSKEIEALNEMLILLKSI